MSKKKKEKKEKTNFDENELNQNNEEFIDDTLYEIDEEFVEETGLQGKLKKLREQLKAEKEKSQEYLTGWQTERASFANYKTQEEKSRKERKKMMQLDFIADLFPVLDSFDMAFSNKEAWEKVDPAWRTGVEYIHTQFMKVLEQYGVQLINQVGVAFDPNVHAPIDTIIIDDKKKADTIAEIIQTGYRSGDTIIRPAKVKVYKYENK
jgi:molecular chaperone GrpE